MLKVITIAAAATIAAPAYAQSSGPGTAFYGPFSPGGYWSQAPRGTARAININPATGRTYSTEADYKVQRRSGWRHRGTPPGLRRK
jgi:hypothetical protein